MPETTPFPSDAREVLISVNPTAGARPVDLEVERLVERLRANDFEIWALSDLDEVSDRANQSYQRGALRALVSVGGDGTVAELVNRTQPGVPITVFPAGNENLLARHVGLTLSAEALVKTITSGRLARFDAGRADGRLFLLMIGCGFDAEVVRRLEEKRTGHVSNHSYVRPILQTVAHYPYKEMLIYFDDPDHARQPAEVSPSKVRWLFAFNLPCYGGGLRFAPEADGTDGLLDVYTFRRGSTWHGLRYLLALILRRHRRLADCRCFRSGRLRIEAEGEVPYQLDGDFAGFLPVEVDVVPDRLSLLIPSEHASQPTG